MTNYSQPSRDDVIRSVYGFAAGLMREGKSDYQIEKALIDKGLDAESARGVVSNLSRMRSEAIRKYALKNMAIGAAICVVGIIVTFGTYSAAAASSKGGSYVVAWGAIIFGGLRFFRALSQYNR